MVASENRAKAAQEAAAAAAATQQEELKRITEELKQAREAIEKARQAEVAAKAEAERKWAAAEEERRKAEAARADADRATRAAREEAQKATAAKEEAEKRWKAGIQPVVTPSLEELEKVKRRIQYKEGIFHFAVAGVAGSGKSSLINAFRGLRNRDASAAATGVTETTLAMARYPDANPQHPFVWFDIPGAGTLKIPDWQYFNAQGLYVFDCIIVLFDNRFTMTDVAILSNAKRFKIPTYMVRSKADQHIRNLMRDMGYDSEQDDEDDPGRRARLLTAARKQYIEETRKSVKTNMENAGLPDQRVYIVSNDNVLGMVKGNTPRRAIDEVALLTDLFTEAHVRREKAAKMAQEETKRAVSAKEEIEKRWKEGIQPVVTPTVTELEAAKRRVQYKEGLFHFAVAGVAGSGKSSLINALRGLRNREAGAAATGVTETTRVFDRYPDPNPQYPLVWYDIPGAGTLKIPDWQYFNAQGLYVFDCIIVLFDNRFTMTDVAILSNCARFNIPAFIVRSKADQHIRNVMKEMGHDSDDEDSNSGSHDRLYREARQHFIEETRRNVKSNLENANLPDRRAYIVSNDTLLSIVKGKAPRKAIDEIELLRDIVNQALARRGRTSEGSTSS
ncbi:interferon-inducible GTPase-domain-containing protein [Pisolithus croceorrhizus]|nr:interferon-inducible GTPase-domain-containing protein [Pisolithus croceorrhizus]KAI6166343.1 interferon-inducible GTPase-domain-containing protein [Pisolithus thermaeus]